MRTTLIALSAAAALAGMSTAVLAQDTTVIRRDGPAGTVVEKDTTGSVERKTVTRSTDGTGCGSKTVHKENSLGESKTVHKEGCD
ncbi:hypothetical protein [Methylobacterium isbiliense]|jgi:hypothetical protein|uniref:DUF5666 domain-containing protein n=1 Tax=Methylobacterium isbiliense TaxID=315478 RepID=A0ABQ4SL99_9HYPH|nr:hypothetical protein [Methylobacterium isbiliense]MDN3626541.1 hypothetical protein [Methylobacterium isbiliense]GJE03942.1 hypothetical protein GMJLKIPL_5899 [Methylobacterium isbiliense]